MKKLLFAATAAFTFVIALSFINKTEESGITGTIDPADGARKVWAISGRDSVAAVPAGGKFQIAVKPGNWNLLIEAVAPYKNTAVENLMVLEGHPTDAGIIKLSQ